MEKSEHILFLSFNQDSSCFSVGTESGFSIFSTNPLKETYSRDLNGGIGQAEMIYKCNILALVGGGDEPKYPLSKLMLWDDHQIKVIAEISYRSEVKSVKLKQDRVLVALENKIFLYNFSDLKLISSFETCPNPLGLISMNSEGDYTTIACLDVTLGLVNAVTYVNNDKKSIQIKAHESSLNALQLNQKGTLLATASQKGTFIRIFDTNTGDKIQELRRGNEYAFIQSLAFDPKGVFVACSSDSGTIHIFVLNRKKEIDENDLKNMQIKNPKSKISWMGFIMPYLNSEKSFAQFRVQDSRTIVAFNSTIQNQIHILSYDGKYYVAEFEIEKGGDCQLKFEGKIYKKNE